MHRSSCFVRAWCERQAASDALLRRGGVCGELSLAGVVSIAELDRCTEVNASGSSIGRQRCKRVSIPTWPGLADCESGVRNLHLNSGSRKDEPLKPNLLQTQRFSIPC